MKEITIVSGPMRSGTSCVTGLLELCGFDLGRNIRVLRDLTPMNPRGHFELDLLFAINERLLVEIAPFWGIFTPPPSDDIMALAGRREKYFRLFLKEFDGELCKDPLFCLTLAAWRKVWPELRRAIFCLRHPLEVASSMQKRYGTSLGEGLRLWHDYGRRFFDNAVGLEVFILDFHRFCREPVSTFSELLDWLKRPQDEAHLKKHVASFWSQPNSALDAMAGDVLPEEVQALYRALCAKSVEQNQRRSPS